MPINYFLSRLVVFFTYLLWARIILSWFPARPGGLLGEAFAVLHAITEPVLAPLRKVIPPIQMGHGYLDLAPIILLILLSFLRGAL
ncbi:MAG: YggT family protein [Firmicutes bacterium]|nr:YggT family protein [Bacillota bacterium]